MRFIGHERYGHLPHIRLPGRRAVLASLACLLIAGCASAPPSAATRATPESDAIRRIESIALLPVVFPSPQEDPRLTSHVFNALTLALAEKGYVLHRAGPFAAADAVSPQQLRHADADGLIALLPDSGRHYLLCWIDELTKDESLLVDRASIRLTVVLIDRETRKVLWRNAEQNTATTYFMSLQTGVIPMVFVRALVDEQTLAVSRGFARLFAGFPEKPMR